MKYLFLAILSILSFLHEGTTQLQVAKIFSDNMVLQADHKIPIWGNAEPNSTIEVLLDDELFSGVADSKGHWKIVLPSKKIGTIVTLKVKNKTEGITFSNVIYGDVWLCGGQSNMEWYVEGADNPEKEIKNATYPNIRIFDVPRNISNEELRDLPSGNWAVCSPKTISQFSAVGYYFGRALHDELNQRPIGLIGNNYGGTVVEAWTSEKSLLPYPFLAQAIKKFKETDIDDARKTGDKAFNSWLSTFFTADQGIQDSMYQWSNIEPSSWNTMQLPTLWEASQNSTLKDKDGVIWFTREFQIDELSDGVLHLGPIDDTDITWINGHKIGETYNQYNKDRTYKIDKSVLKLGKNRITIRVEDYVGGGGIYGKADMMNLEFPDKKIALAGAWKYKIGMLVTTEMPSNSFSPNNFPTCLYNGMISPITQFPIKGIIWYQGESNSYRAYEYQTLFPLMIQDWRKQWNQPNLPFLYVQLANFNEQQIVPKDSEWAELREAQAMALNLPNTAMITAIDIGDAANIHPTNKQEVGKRLANAAMSTVYNNPRPYQGPTYKSHEAQGNSIIITFENVGDGLLTDDKFGYVYGFTIAGKDKNFAWAKAEIISKNQVRVWNLTIQNPISVRYSWQNNPARANLKNSFRLPAFPFRTDNYTISTFDINRL